MMNMLCFWLSMMGLMMMQMDGMLMFTIHMSPPLSVG